MKNNDAKGSIVPVSSLIMVASVMFGSHAGSGKWIRIRQPGR